jgi:hypothetical protein
MWRREKEGKEGRQFLNNEIIELHDYIYIAYA